MRLFIIVILIGIFSILYTEIAQSAELTILDNRVFVKTDTYEIQFKDGVITQLHNRLTAETYTLPLGIGGHSGLLKKDGSHIWTSDAAVTSARKIAPLKAEIVFTQEQSEIRLFIAIDQSTGDLVIEQKGTSDTAGIYGIQWGCGNLDTQNLDLVLPAEGGQVIDATSPFTSKDFNYPGSWEVQLAIVQGQQGGFSVRGTDATFQFKVLHYQKDVESFALGFETQNQAPFDTLTSAKSVVWRLNTYTGDWQVPARQYRDWMERTFKPWRLDKMPAWVQEIGLVVIYFGLDIRVLDKLAEQTDPTKTLLYTVHWRKDGFDENNPDYTAHPEFGKFVKAAHQYGFRVMPHVNLVGVSTYHPLYVEFQQFQFRDPWNENLVGLHWDERDHLHRYAWINLASSKFRKFFVQQLKEVWQQYRVDAFHLDISHAVVNDANGLIEGINAGQGNVLMHKELAEAMPGVVFSGEHLHEVTFFRESFAQRWKLPPEWDLSPRGEPHSISASLFSSYTLPYGYLGMPNPDGGPQLYQEYLESYENWGVLPTLRIWSMEDLAPERSRTQELLSIARTWQELGLKPNFETDWGTDTLFQYVGKGGEIATLKTTEDGSIFDLPQRDAGYERIFGVTQVKTDRSIPHWRAYNENGILGLEPKKSYLLSDVPRDFSQMHINSLPEGVSVTESRVTKNAALFRLESTDVVHEIDLLSQFHLARTGIIVNGKELPVQKGATFRRGNTSLADISKDAIRAQPPWQGIRGNTFGEWKLLLPNSPGIHLEFDIGLLDGAGFEKSDGATFIVSVQEEEIFRQHYNQRQWKHISLDLTTYRGQQIVLRFTTDPGSNEDPGWDWPRWGEPKIVSESLDALTKVGFFLPNEPTKTFPNTVEDEGKGQYSIETELPAQVLFLFESGAEVVFPYNLRDIGFVAGLQFGGIFQHGSVHNSGARTIATIGGIRKASIIAHPPPDGQTVLQYLLNLPRAREIVLSFSGGLPGRCSLDGLCFKVLLNGQNRFEHFVFNTPGWVNGRISLSEFAGETIILELVTDSVKTETCDWAYWADLLITAKGMESSGDVNQDGIVNVLDIILVAQNLGQNPPANPRADVNKDGQVNVLDLVFVAEWLGEKVAAAPSQVDIVKPTVFSSENIIAVQRALRELDVLSQKSHNLKMAIQFLNAWLADANQNIPETKLLPNYPNPFNPETWIPYQLAESADVSVKIYDVGGRLVRTISTGFKPVGYYLTQERAAYWNGHNETGEPVSSGVYFLQFVAGDFSATRRIVMLK